MKEIPLEQRLVVAADFTPDESGRTGVRQKVLALAENLKGLGVVIKINSILRACGYDLISEIHNHGLQVAADLKIPDVPDTMTKDGLLLAEFKPEFLTVMANSGVDSMSSIKKVLPDTEVWGVTVLTSLKDDKCKEIYLDDAEPTVCRLVALLNKAGLDGVICSPKEVKSIRANPEWDHLTVNNPGIRYPWSEIGSQARYRTACEAIAEGADRVVVGGPILKAKPNDDSSTPQNPREAVMLILGNIKAGLDKFQQTH